MLKYKILTKLFVLNLGALVFEDYVIYPLHNTALRMVTRVAENYMC